MFFSIPLTFAIAIIFTGDGETFFEFYTKYIFPSLSAFFVLKIIVTIAFFKKKKWAFIFNYIENILLLIISALPIPLMFIALFFTDNLAQSIIQSITALIFPVLFMLLFWTLTKKYNKIKKSGIFFILLALLSTTLIINPQNTQAQSEITEILLLDAAPNYESSPYPYDFKSTDIKDFFKLNENGKYPSVNLFDGYYKTCWVAGSSKTDTKANLYIKLPATIDIENIILNIFSGYGKSKQLYHKNSRPKKIELSVFSAFHPENFSTEVASLYVIKESPFKKEIDLSDTFGVQSFPLNLNKKALLDFQKKASAECKSFTGYNYKQFSKASTPKKFTPSFILKLEITEIYPRTKYSDICISELFFNNRFITPQIPINITNLKKFI